MTAANAPFPRLASSLSGGGQPPEPSILLASLPLPDSLPQQPAGALGTKSAKSNLWTISVQRPRQPGAPSRSISGPNPPGLQARQPTFSMTSSLHLPGHNTIQNQGSVPLTVLFTLVAGTCNCPCGQPAPTCPGAARETGPSTTIHVLFPSHSSDGLHQEMLPCNAQHKAERSAPALQWWRPHRGAVSLTSSGPLQCNAVDQSVHYASP